MNSRFFLVLILVLCLAGLAFAQSSTGTIQGTVADANGAVIPNASVTVTNLGTNRAIVVTSNGEGLYSLPALDPGPYKVEVQVTNFKATTQQVTLQTAQVLNLEFKLQPGSTSETVEVTAEVPIVDTSTSGVGNIVTGRQIDGPSAERPQFHRPGGSWFQASRADSPGTSKPGQGNQAETFRYAASGGGALSANGLRVQANNFLFDGIDNNESLVNTIVFFVDPDAIQEFRVDTNVAPAEYGRAGGAVVNATYKSGTNNWHGTAFWQIGTVRSTRTPTISQEKPSFAIPPQPVWIFRRRRLAQEQIVYLWRLPRRTPDRYPLLVKQSRFLQRWSGPATSRQLSIASSTIRAPALLGYHGLRCRATTF